jgi:hypothetical protein
MSQTEQLPGPDAPVMPKAKTPVEPGRISLVGVVLAVLVILVGLIGVRDALTSAGVLSGESWLERGIDALDGLEPQWWLVPLGVLLVMLGLWLLLVALRPRPRTAVALTSETGVFMHPRELKKLTKRAADDVDGVTSTRVSATRRVAKVTVTVTGEKGHVAEEVRAAVQDRLAALDPPPRVKVTTRVGGAL